MKEQSAILPKNFTDCFKNLELFAKKPERVKKDFISTEKYLNNKRRYDTIKNFNLDLRKNCHLTFLRRIERMSEKDYKLHRKMEINIPLLEKNDVVDKETKRIENNKKWKKHVDWPHNVSYINK